MGNLLKGLESVPTWMGEVFYPFGSPMGVDMYCVGGESIQNKFLRHCDGKSSMDDLKYLKEYVVYYIYSPMLDMVTEDLKEKDLMSMDFDTLVGECLEYGLDPF